MIRQHHRTLSAFLRRSLIQPGRSVYVYTNAPPITSSPTNHGVRSISGLARDWRARNRPWPG